MEGLEVLLVKFSVDGGDDGADDGGGSDVGPGLEQNGLGRWRLRLGI